MPEIKGKFHISPKLGMQKMQLAQIILCKNIEFNKFMRLSDRKKIK